MRRLLTALLCTALASSAYAAEPLAVAIPGLRESSGLARSHLEPGVLWTHNDSGGKPEAYAMDTRGRLRATLHIHHAWNLDWEDMASYVEQGTPRLLLADIGDNHGLRPHVTLYVVDEPRLPAGPGPFLLDAPDPQVIKLHYPDGARDAEAVAVDARAGIVYILTKKPPRLYQAALHPGDGGSTHDAEALGSVTLPDAGEGPTAMDIDEQGRRLAVISRERAWLFRRAPGESWPQALVRPPQEMSLPRLGETEGAVFTPSGRSLWVIAEGYPALLDRIALGAPLASRAALHRSRKK